MWKSSLETIFGSLHWTTPPHEWACELLRVAFWVEPILQTKALTSDPVLKHPSLSEFHQSRTQFAQHAGFPVFRWLTL